ncbi:MAG: hypothetical protein U1F20_09655 [Lysobacterales bacterium]
MSILRARKDAMRAGDDEKTRAHGGAGSAAIGLGRDQLGLGAGASLFLSASSSSPCSRLVFASASAATRCCSGRHSLTLAVVSRRPFSSSTTGLLSTMRWYDLAVAVGQLDLLVDPGAAPSSASCPSEIGSMSVPSRENRCRRGFDCPASVDTGLRIDGALVWCRK